MRNEDVLKGFIEDFYNLSKLHYHSYKLDKEVCLKYSANDLDMAYECGYYEFLDAYYEEYLSRKHEFPKITINKLNNDFIILFDESLLEEEYVIDENDYEEIPF